MCVSDKLMLGYHAAVLSDSGPGPRGCRPRPVLVRPAPHKLRVSELKLMAMLLTKIKCLYLTLCTNQSALQHKTEYLGLVSKDRVIMCCKFQMGCDIKSIINIMNCTYTPFVYVLCVYASRAWRGAPAASASPPRATRRARAALRRGATRRDVNCQRACFPGFILCVSIQLYTYYSC